MEALKQRRQGEGPSGPAAGGSSEALEEEGAPIEITLPARKRRVLDVLREQLAVSESDSDGDGDGDGDDGLVLDWRAKGV